MSIKYEPSIVEVPWRRNRQWASRLIRDQSSRFVFFSVLFCLIFNTVAWSTMTVAWSERAREPALLIVAGILVLMGLAMLAWALRQMLVRTKFGRSVFELETLPGAIGGWLAGTIRVPVILDATKGVRLELECIVRSSSRQLNGEMSSHEETLLKGKQILARNIPREGMVTCIPVAFEVPSHARPTGRVGRDVPVGLRATTCRPVADPALADPTFPIYGVSL